MLKFISPNEAMVLYTQRGYGKVGRQTMISWIHRYAIGVKVGGRWKIDVQKFTEFMEKGVDQE